MAICTIRTALTAMITANWRHTAVKHDGHSQYLHDGHLHYVHGDDVEVTGES
jgi:hypothetical protein